MAKVRNLQEAMEKYKSTGGSDFFSLENDKDTATVRFLHEGQDEFDSRDGGTWFVVHEVEINGKKRWVECTEEADCPLCIAAKVDPKVSKAKLRLFIQLIDKRDGKQKIWERGQQFIGKITGCIQRYGNLCNRPYEIQRNGKKGDTATTYELYNMDKDDKTLADLPPKQELASEDGFILRISVEKMKAIANGTFAPASGASNSADQAAPRAQAPRTGSDVF